MVYNSFIHSFVDSDTKVDNYELPSLSILCSSLPYHKYLKVTIHIYPSSIFLLDSLLSFFLQSCPLVSVNVINHSNTCPAYSIFLLIMSIVKYNSVCNSSCTRSMTYGAETWYVQLMM